MTLASASGVGTGDPFEDDDTGGSQLSRWLTTPNPREVSVRALQRADLSIAEVRCDAPNYGFAGAQREDGFALGIQLRDYPSHVLWSGGKEFLVTEVRRGDTLIADLSSVEAVETRVPFHSLQFLLSRKFLDSIAEDSEAPRIGEIRGLDGIAVRDPVLADVAESMLPLLSTPDDVDELQAAHIMLALGTYVCATYGDMRTPQTVVGGLSAWQKRVAIEIIDAHLATGLGLDYVASLCGLRVSQFAHAFKRTLGVAPYQWLQQRRIEKAKELLRRPRLPISEVALLCGFCDQSHLNRIFRRIVGATPAFWRSQQKA